MSEEKKAPAPIQISHTYTLTEYNVVKKAKMLLKDGHMVKCHKCGPQLIPNNQLGTLAPMYEHCTTHCSRALIGVENEKVVYIQTCEVQNQKFVIENANPSTEKESTLFINR